MIAGGTISNCFGGLDTDSCFLSRNDKFWGQDAQNGAVLGESHESNELREGIFGNIGKERKITGIYHMEKGDNI